MPKKEQDWKLGYRTRLMDSNLIRIAYPFTSIPSLLGNSSLSLLPPIPTNSGGGRLQKLRNCSAQQKKKNKVAFDEAAYEAERLSLDAEARQSMAETSNREIQNAPSEDDPKAWKWVIRKRIWNLMESQNIAQNPRPVHHRIPNFVGASAAADNVKNYSFSHFQ